MNEDFYIESLYAHCDTILVRKGQLIKRGEKIATIGNAHGQYLAHLHFEIRSKIDQPIEGGYSENTEGFMNSTEFINKNRQKK